jgi:alpha-tubulin suppressor-like RCC1 family protein
VVGYEREILDVPDGLTNIIAISEGQGDSFALKADGTVVAWGMDLNGQSEVPASLTNVVAISAKSSRSLALRADGTGRLLGRNKRPCGLA